MISRIIFLVLFGFLIDFLIFRELRQQKFLRILHLLIAVGFVIDVALFVVLVKFPGFDPDKYRTYLYLFDTAFILYGPKALIAIIIVLAKLFRLVLGRNVYQRSLPYWKTSGWILSSLFFLMILYGITWGKSNFQVKEVNLDFPNLPPKFEGFRIVQFSDVHLGNWSNPEDVRKGLKLINEQNPDLIVLTGDLINISSNEINPYIQDLKALHAPYGKYAILGNHDIGDFTRFGNEDYYPKNSTELTRLFPACGFQLMRNSHVIFSKGEDSLVLSGVDNWSSWKFRKLGQLNLAMNGTENLPFHILLTHDPSHWRAQVLDKKVDLTLSGHTHGMQIGIHTDWLNWSPVNFKYKEWLGLYREKEQLLYVNPGFGFVGFSGRIGMPPEITVLVLHRK